MTSSASSPLRPALPPGAAWMLITKDSHSKRFVVNPEAFQLLSSIDGDIYPVAVASLFRTGKIR